MNAAVNAIITAAVNLKVCSLLAICYVITANDSLPDMLAFDYNMTQLMS